MNSAFLRHSFPVLGVLGLLCGRPAGSETFLEGRVRVPSGNPVPGAQVMLFDLTDFRRLALATTDEAGWFVLSLQGLPAAASGLPERFSLGNNYPNPFNPSTIIPYQLGTAGHVRLEVFNLLGQRIATLVDGQRAAGFHRARWDGTDARGLAVGAGVYLYRLQSGSMVATERMVLVDGQAGVPAPGQEERADGPDLGTAQTATTRATAVYGLTISGPGLVTYVNPAFEVQAVMGSLELEVEESHGMPRAKAAASGLSGDVDNNGRVDIMDALLVATYIADNSTPMPNNGDISQGDMNGDGRIDYFDVWLIATQFVFQQLGDPGAVDSASKMYWLDRGTDRIQRSNLDGSNLQTLVTAGLSGPRDLALDAAGGKMYWTDDGLDKIQRANLDGSQVEDLVAAGLIGPAALELDLAAGKMYWTDQGTGKIQRADLDGSRAEDLVAGLGDPNGLALDIPAGKMYWTDQHRRRIQRANLDGSDVQDLVRSGLRAPAALALDTGSGKMYWSDWGTDQIRRSNLDGSRVEDLVTAGLNLVEGLALDVEAGKMYWTDSGTARIKRANLDGSNVVDLITAGLSAPSGLALHLATPGQPAPPAATLSPDPSAVGFLNDGTWHAFTVQASESIVVVVNPSGMTPRAESAGASGVANECPAESRDSLTREDGQSIYLAGCSAGPAKVELRRASDQTLLRTYAFSIEEIPAATTGPTVAKIYWTNGDKIQRAGSDGSNVEDLVTSGSPRALAVDVLAGRIYWTDQDTRWIWRADLDGSEAELVVGSGLIRPVAIALDLTRGKVYWTDSGSNRIQRANLNGSRVETLVRTGLHSPEGLALDVDAGKVYWSDYGTNKIQRANLDGSQVEDLVTTGLRIPGELALDVGAGKIYWTDYGTDKIQRADLDGSNVEDLVTTGLRVAKGLALDAAAGKVYWSDSGTGKIQRASLDGSGVEDLVSRPGEAPAGLALALPAASLSPNPIAVPLSRRGTWRRFEVQTSEPILVVANPTGTEPRIMVAQSQEAIDECSAMAESSVTRYHGQSVYLAACEPGEAVVELRSLSGRAIRTYAMRVPDRTRMYWTNAGTWDKIQRADIDGSNVEDLVTTGLSEPIDVALDVTEGKMYWVDHGIDKIQRANLDGSNVEDLITTGLRYPVGLALDLTAHKMYWTDMELDRIMRADLDGSNVEALVTNGLSRPRGLALDLVSGRMYWIDQVTEKIQRANLDGSSVQDIVTTGFRGPDRLALDLEGNHIYWTGGGKVQRANLDGSNVEDLVTELWEPRGIALDLNGGKVYWTDSGTDKIQRANLDGSNVQDLVTGVVGPTAIALE